MKNVSPPFLDIIKFYEGLTTFLPERDRENPCGGCKECCRYLFYLSRYEFDYLIYSLGRGGEEVHLQFVPLLPGKEDPRCAMEESLCPLYREPGGCRAYEGRPLACRLMGPYVPLDSELITSCIYKEPVIYSTVEEIPLWNEFTRILRRHPSLPGYFVVSGAYATSEGSAGWSSSPSPAPRSSGSGI